MSSLYPRVLLVNQQPIGRRDATGITMGNLFRGWPLDRIAQIYSWETAPDETVCVQSWRLDEVDDLPMPRWLRGQVVHKRSATHVAPTREPLSAEEPSRAPASLTGWVAGEAKSLFHHYAQFVPYAMPPEIDRKIAAFAPEMIYSLLEDRRMTYVALRCAEKSSLPLVPHFMDDWMATSPVPPSGLLEKWAERDRERKALRALLAAPLRLVIGEYMAEAYRQRYGCAFIPFSNCIDLDERPAIRRTAESGRVFRFGFIGRLVLGRAEAFADIVDVLESLNSAGTNIELIIFKYDPRDALPDHVDGSKVMRLSTEREDARLQTADADIDAFLHVDTFDRTAGAYSRFSLSSKVPWYLAAGIPLFAYGARELGTMRFLSDHRCAAVVDRKDRRLLQVRLQEFVDDSGGRQALGLKARLVAREHFDAQVQRDAFRRALAQACSSADAGKPPP
jgi:glycosyltransferase involved in cell wall biosynthesis